MIDKIEKAAQLVYENGSSPRYLRANAHTFGILRAMDPKLSPIFRDGGGWYLVTAFGELRMKEDNQLDTGIFHIDGGE